MMFQTENWDLSPAAHLDRAKELLEVATPRTGEPIIIYLDLMLVAARHAALGNLKIGIEAKQLLLDLGNNRSSPGPY